MQAPPILGGLYIFKPAQLISRPPKIGGLGYELGGGGA